MNSLKLLYVEDKEEDLNTCRDTVARYEHQTERKIELVVARTVSEALATIDRHQVQAFSHQARRSKPESDRDDVLCFW